MSCEECGAKKVRKHGLCANCLHDLRNERDTHSPPFLDKTPKDTKTGKL